MPPQPPPRNSAVHSRRRALSPTSLVTLNVAANALLIAAAVVVYLEVGSQLVLAQGSDSLLDVGTGLILLWSVRIARQPRDEDHPFGHQRAEPIGALVAAVLAGVLGFEVLRSAVWNLVAGEPAELDASVALLLGGKLALKVALLLLLTRALRRVRSSALSATRVDARNDIVAGASSVLGCGLSELGFARADSLLAIPIAFYIGYSGVRLARENLRFLMGEAPSPKVLEELGRIVAETDGVLEVQHLRAQHVGPELLVDVAALVAEGHSAARAHDIAARVQARLEAREDVGEAFVHIDTPSTAFPPQDASGTAAGSR